MTDIRENLADVRSRIEAACRAAGRPRESVTLVAISKRHSSAAVREAASCGQIDFGENYVQELVAKGAEVSDLSIRWHFVGHLQRNKAKDVVRANAVIHTVDSLRLAEEIARRAETATTQCRVFLQVNVAGESQKSGCEPGALANLVRGVRALGAIDLAGLMTMPPASEDPETARPIFRRLRELAAEHGLADLSMGMSHDLEVAVQEGATLVRVGTAIFGERS